MTSEASERESVSPTDSSPRREMARFGKYALSFVVALLLGLVTSFAFERSMGRDQVVRGVRGMGRSLAGLDRVGLERALAAQNVLLSQFSFTLQLGKEKLERRGAELSMGYDTRAEAQRALALGREGHVLNQFGFWFSRLFSPVSFQPIPRVHEDELRSALSPWLQEVLPEPRPPSLSYRDGLLVDEGSAGTVVDYADLSRRLARAFQERDSSALELSTKKAPRLVPLSQVNERRVLAERLIAGPILIEVEVDEEPDDKSKETSRKVEVSLPPERLGLALSGRVDEEGRFRLDLSVDVLRNELSALLSRVERPAKDARFEFGPGGRVSIDPSSVGRAVDAERLVGALFAASGENERRIELPLSAVEPSLSTEQAENLGIKGLVSSFTTRHKCCQPRVENIHTAADRIDSVVLRPGQRFSLNDRLGPRTASAGYRRAPTIVRGEMEEMFGGGISQLATTLFNAVLRGGYAIVQRQPHSIYFPRYPEGHEATVSYPQPDLIFENDTAAGMVIKTHYTDRFIKVSIYGDNEKRRVRIDKSKRYDIVEPPTEYEAESEMEPSKSRLLRAGQLGWTVMVSREITFNDGKKKTEKREVKYNPRAQLLRVHPCMIPEGAEGHTGEDCPEPEREEREEELSDDVFYETTNFGSEKDYSAPPDEEGS